MRCITRTAPFALALTLAGLLGACQSDPEGDAVDNYISGADAYAKGVCRCDYNNPLIALGIYTSDEACLEELPANNAEIGCVRGVFQDEATDYTGTLNCRAAAFREATSCLGAAQCSEDGTRLDCYSQLADELEDCDEFEPGVEAKLNDCQSN